MILKNNEEKRSTLWRTVLTVSTVLIIIVAVFFIVRLFVGNPLKGTWVSEDSGAVLEILDDGELKMSGTGDGRDFSDLRGGHKGKDSYGPYRFRDFGGRTVRIL